MKWKDGEPLTYITIIYKESKYYFEIGDHPVPARGGDIYKAADKLGIELGEFIALGWENDESWLKANGYEKI